MGGRDKRSSDLRRDGLREGCVCLCLDVGARKAYV